jgi:hypothetical protein
MVNGVLDSVLFLQSLDNLILKAATAAQVEHPRVVFFGECVDLLWKQGNVEAAIQVEKLGVQLSRRYDVDILCGYSLEGRGVMEEESFSESVQSTQPCIILESINQHSEPIIFQHTIRCSSLDRDRLDSILDKATNLFLITGIIQMVRQRIRPLQLPCCLKSALRGHKN